MKRVRHDGLGDGTIVFNELGAKIEIENVAAIIEPGKGLIYLEDVATLPVECLACLLYTSHHPGMGGRWEECLEGILRLAQGHQHGCQRRPHPARPLAL